MQFLNCSLAVKHVQPDETGSFEGYASVFNAVDQQHERVSPGAFQTSLSNWKKDHRLPKMLWQHDPQTPIGFWESMVEDDYGLFVRGKILLDIQQGREAYTLLKSGVVDGLSIGFLAKKTHLDGAVRVLDEVDLYEVSLVTFMANPHAKVTSFKNWTAPPESDASLLQRLRALRRAMERTDATFHALLRERLL